ncbi:MAG: GPW/gp25 family protein [Proteobacteria bacterium]|nr:GPW/gp25 family protein [Pseudomonadota bacterium]
MSNDVDFPYRVDGRGRTALADSDDDHVRDLIEELLFTVPGERANRPDFGCGLMQLVFEPNSIELAATIQALVQGSLQQWLGTLIRVNAVDADASDATLTVQVSYTLLADQQSKTASFTQKVAS